ncbi:MAG: YihY/virulence factor BrkB family protein [Eubacteriales bacterium]|nr:YihY/virulence factor BrkB family protein [Eubacteriales bacterium]
MKESFFPHSRTPFGKVAAAMVRRYFSHDVARDSAALTYYLLFAIFPLLIFVSMLLGALHLDVASVTQTLSQFIPAEVLGIITGYLSFVTAHSSSELLVFSLVFSVWFPMRAVGCLLHSMRKAVGRSRPQSVVRGLVYNLLFTLWLIVSIVLSLLLIVVGKRALMFFGRFFTLSPLFINGWNALRFLVLALVMTVLLMLLHMLALGERRPLGEALPGIAASLVLWLLLSLGFSYYVEKRAHYALLYGSIATTIVALLWMYISATVFLLGAEFNGALLEYQKEKSLAAAEGSGREETK